MGIEPRLNLYSSVQTMFHRYAYDDFGGYLLNTGQFNYIRYASIADGPFVHEETGQRFPDPLGREEGEYISERRGEEYYRDKKKEPRVWNSMFQGRPSSQEGDFFTVARMQKIERVDVAAERAKCVYWVRAWDNAATDGGGDHTAGTLLGIQPDGTVLIDDLILKQYSSEKVAQLRKDTAKTDGKHVAVCVPLERAQAGKALVFHTEQDLKGYTVVSRDVVNNTPGSDAKKRRAYNFSIAVNAGMVKYASDDHIADPEDKWNETLLRCMRNFGFSSFDDPIDSTSDGYNWLFEQLARGMVIASFAPRNLLLWERFAQRFLPPRNGDAPSEKVPANFTIYAGVKITPDASQPNSAAIVARAPANADMPETLFLVAEYKNWTGDFYECFDWLRDSLDRYCESTKTATIWLHPDSEMYAKTVKQKLKRNVWVFEDDEVAGLTEMNWHMLPTDAGSQFGSQDARFYCLIRDAEQLTLPVDAGGMASFRQEAMTWGFDDKGKPNKLGGVADCVRMISHAFRTRSVPMTVQELAARRVAEMFPPEKMAAAPPEQKGDLQTFKRMTYVKEKEKITEEQEARPAWADL
jgi:predicted phage terminase large subunit-like protein